MGVSFEALAEDGDHVEAMQTVARLEGPARAVLTGERLALNFLMRLSGIATNTAKTVEAAQGKIKVVDTRKTTPLHRRLEKDAVVHGGGHNHRFALYDAVLIKDNHIHAAGGAPSGVQGQNGST